MQADIQFWLNDELVTVAEPPGLLVLDYLRKRKRLVGTKEGCKEGDCGACTVLIGEENGGKVEYRPVTSCLLPLGELHRKHLVTIEGLDVGDLSPVQQVIVDNGGTQCGFCTPAIVVSLTWYLMTDTGTPTMDGIKRALSGHLCRCTGYSSLKRGGETLLGVEGFWQAEDRIATLAAMGALPDYFNDMPDRLRRIPSRETPLPSSVPDHFVAGGTDIYVQRGDEMVELQVQVLNVYPEMKGIAERGGNFHIGALTTFEEFAGDPRIVAIIPRIEEYMFLIASLQLRNRATLGGNIVNASPIGDMTILLLALDCELVLRLGQRTRTVALKEFFHGYKTLDKEPGEILTEIVLPVPSPECKIHFEKVSKRKCLDIATVNSAVKVRATSDGIVEEANVTMGGVAPVPLFLKRTSEFLAGKEISADTLAAACAMAQDEISPISDVRGTANYKRLLVQQFILAHFTELYPQHVELRQLLSNNGGMR